MEIATIDKLALAEALEQQLYAALSALGGIARIIEEQPVPEAVVWRGHQIERVEAIDSLDRALDALADAETFIRQHRKNQRFQPLGAKAA